MTKWCDWIFSYTPLYFLQKRYQKVVMGLMAKKENDFDNLNLQMTDYFLIPMLKTK